MIEAKSEAEVSNASAEVQVLPVSVIVPVRNEARNLSRCLDSLAGFGEVYVIDSESTDDTVAIAQSRGAKVVQFHYAGGWPKKRQWAMDTLPLAYDWILLLDADEVLTPELVEEIRRALQNPVVNGYSIRLQMYFLGRVLRRCDASFWKLSLFRKGRGRFECRLKDQDPSMADIEIHEHVVVDASAARRRSGSSERGFIWHAGAAPKMAQAKSLSLAGFSDSAVSLSLCFLSRISRWCTGADLLRLSSGADVPFQVQNLRTEVRTEVRTKDGEELRPCAASPDS